MPVSQRETFSFYQASEAKLEALGTTLGEGFAEHTNFSNGSSNSIGYLYELVTTMLGFHFMDTGKTMGLAAWGTPKLLDALRAYTKLGPTFDDCFRFDPFQGFVDDAQRFLQSGSESFQARADLAASIQELLTETLLHCYWLIEDLEFSVLLLSGGCALEYGGQWRARAKASRPPQPAYPTTCQRFWAGPGCALALRARPGDWSLRADL